MNDLIHRQDAIAVADYSDYAGLSVDDVKRVTDEVVKGLRRLPSAQPVDVVEVVYGEWIKMDKRGNNVQCSKCGNTLDLRGVNAGRGDANYCPNCGADMRPRLQGTEIDGMYIDISGDGTVVEQI